MVQVLCFSAEVTVETPVASRKKTSPGQVRNPLSASVPLAAFLGFEASLYLLGGATGHKARELAKEASDKSWLYNVQLKSKRPFYFFTDVVVGWRGHSTLGDARTTVGVSSLFPLCRL